MTEHFHRFFLSSPELSLKMLFLTSWLLVGLAPHFLARSLIRLADLFRLLPVVNHFFLQTDLTFFYRGHRQPLSSIVPMHVFVIDSGMTFPLDLIYDFNREYIAVSFPCLKIFPFSEGLFPLAAHWSVISAREEFYKSLITTQKWISWCPALGFWVAL